MAVFNPEIKPTNDPRFGGDSRAIDTPESIRQQGVQQNQIMPEGQRIGDRSAEFEGMAAAAGIQKDAISSKGYGDLFANIVGIGDYLGKAGVALVKKDIETKVYEMADAERQAYTAELEGLAGKGTTKSLLDSNASMDEVPEDIAELPESLAVLQAARAGGKITKVDYQGRLLEKAKALRAQYPGFKKEIDAEFAAVTGQNPANARINSLIAQINQQAALGSKEQTAIKRFFIANQGLPNMNENYAKVMSGQMTEHQFMMIYTPYKQAEEQIRMNALKLQDKNATRGEADIQAKRTADQALGVSVAGVADRMMGELGLTGPQDVQTLESLEKNGGIPKQKWDLINKSIANEITRLTVQASAEMDRQGITSKLVKGSAERNQIIKEKIQPLLDLQQRVINKDFGGMYEVANQSKLILDQGKHDMLKDSAAGPFAVLANNLREFGLEEYSKKMVMDMVMKKGGEADSTADWFKGYKLRFNTNANNPMKDNKVVTFNDMYEEAKKKGISDPTGNLNIVKEVEKIGKRTLDDGTPIPDSVKESLALSAFSPGNRGFLSKVNADGFDSRGRPVSGQHGLYTRWTAPEITNEMKRLGKAKPEIWNNYETWGRETGAVLIKEEVNNLAAMTKDPNIKIEWDSENKRFNATRTDAASLVVGRRQERGGEGKNSYESVAQAKQFEDVQRRLNKINGVLYNVKNIAQESMQEKDVDAYLLRTVHEANPDSLKNVQSIPLDMLNKIMMGRAYGIGNRK